MPSNKAVAVGMILLFGVAGYLIYYLDRKRRLDPDYKRRLRESRKQRNAVESVSLDLNDSNSVREYFYQQHQLGDKLIRQEGLDDFAKGVEHLSTAAALATEPDQFLQYLQEQYPQPVYDIIERQVPEAKKRIFGKTALESSS